jgi:hypothetical protein
MKKTIFASSEEGVEAMNAKLRASVESHREKPGFEGHLARLMLDVHTVFNTAFWREFDMAPDDREALAEAVINVIGHIVVGAGRNLMQSREDLDFAAWMAAVQQCCQGIHEQTQTDTALGSFHKGGRA